MKKNLCIFLAAAQGLNFKTDIRVLPTPEYVQPDSDLDRVLREIFTVDPKTGVVKGDVAYFLSGNGNPQIKQWIENNLFTSMRQNGGYDPKTTSDDLIAEFSRKSDETANAYSQRLMKYYSDAKALEDKLKKEANSNPNPE